MFLMKKKRRRKKGEKWARFFFVNPPQTWAGNPFGRMRVVSGLLSGSKAALAPKDCLFGKISVWWILSEDNPRGSERRKGAIAHKLGKTVSWPGQDRSTDNVV